MKKLAHEAIDYLNNSMERIADSRFASEEQVLMCAMADYIQELEEKESPSQSKSVDKFSVIHPMLGRSYIDKNGSGVRNIDVVGDILLLQAENARMKETLTLIVALAANGFDTCTACGHVPELPEMTFTYV